MRCNAAGSKAFSACISHAGVNYNDSSTVTTGNAVLSWTKRIPAPLSYASQEAAGNKVADGPNKGYQDFDVVHY